MTQRTVVLFVLALLAASPLLWMSVDPNAGNTLLSLTRSSKTQLAVNSHSPSTAQVR